jgi:N-hydroxyarylamine O-acetyltransferase
LHLQHNSAIPFENLDVLLPREIHLDDRALEEKLIAARRGGIVLNKMVCWSARCAR